MGIVQQTKYLVLKNFHIKKRNKRETLQEILIPIWLIVMLAILKRRILTEPKPAVRENEIPTAKISSMGLAGLPGIASSKPNIGYVTNNLANAGSVMEIVRNTSKDSAKYVEFNTTDSLIAFYKEHTNLLVGIEFWNGKEKGLAYTLRVPRGRLPLPENRLVGPGECHDVNSLFSGGCPANSYIITKIATLQTIIDAAITKVEGNLPHYNVPDIKAKMMPKASYRQPVEEFAFLILIFMVAAFVPYFPAVLVNPLKEKELKLKELLRIVGTSDIAYLLSWIITYAVIMLVAVLILNVITILGNIFSNSNYIVIVIICYLYGLSIITMSLMLTPFFKSVTSAGLFASLVTPILATIAIPLVLVEVSNVVKWLLSLFSPTAFALALYEAVEGEGLNFDNWSTKGSFPSMYPTLMLLVDTVLYLLLALCFDAVIPGKCGQRRRWKSICSKKEQGTAPSEQLSARVEEVSEDIEAMPADLQGNEVISIHKLRKVYHGKEEVVAVDGVSMDIYEGHVTALLGHNGAGKTTLIAMMTGMVPATEGYATVYGKDITDPSQMREIRKGIGVCQQQNALFDFVTVKEHLELYSGLKEVPMEQRDVMVSSLLMEIDLADQRDTLSKDLSGGQKRKLSVGIALIGDPKVIILDEPTSGMDPYARRLIWSLLKEKCKNRVVLLTTHFMDEADILADYKVILSKGRVRCSGSSLFLKNRFGIGYHLNMALAENCDTQPLIELVQSKVEGAEAIRHHGKEMAFSLPVEQVSCFPDLFKALEDNNYSSEGCAAPLLGVTSYGVSMTTLEEVFLQLEGTSEESKISTDDAQETFEQSDANLLAPSDAMNIEDRGCRISGFVDAPNNTGVELNNPELMADSQKSVWKAKQQVLGLMRIHWLMLIRRSPATSFFKIIILLFFIFAGLLLLRVAKNDSQSAIGLKPLKLTPKMYLKPGSKKGYASFALLQNSTKEAMDHVMKYLSDYSVGTLLVSSMSSILSNSSSDLYNLGFDILKFPADNLSSSSDLSSSFEMRYNDTAVHSVPVGINILGSILHMNALKKQKKAPYPLESTILAFPDVKPQWTYNIVVHMSFLLIGKAFGTILGDLGVLIVAERQMKMRHLLRVSGVSSFVYWLERLISDGIVASIPVILLLTLIPALQPPSLSPPPAMGCVMIATLLYIPAGILFSYLMSFMCNSRHFSEQVLPSVFNLTGIIPYLTVSLVDMLVSRDTAIVLHYVFFITVYESIIAAFRAGGQSVDVEVTASDYFKWTKYNGIPAALIAPVFHTILFSVLIYFLDQHKTGGAVSCKCSKSMNDKNNAHVDRSFSYMRLESEESMDPTNEDVRREKEKVSNMVSIEDSTFSAIVKGLWKRFDSGKKAKTVVKDLYFGVEQGEVFGLLGPNGAGKTTSLNMITGDIPPTRGKVYVAGYDVRKQSHEAFQHMGFCPQEDVLWPKITLQEHLEAFARMRGKPRGEVKRVVKHYLSALGITEHAKKRTQYLSGATKRKASFAMAMLGDPQLLLLDEPSKGVDPSARRCLWNTISSNVHGKRGAVLTTHSMEEADALCSRVGIMVKGQLKCLGSTQHLKSTYGSGYTLELKLKKTHTSGPCPEGSMEQLHNYVIELLPGATQSEVFGGRLIYKVPKEGVGALSVIFTKLEKAKEEIGIEEYSFSQSTLEQVFLEFTKEQDDDRTGAEHNREENVQNGGSQPAV